MEHGVNSFVNHIISTEKVASCKEEIVLVTSQLISFKEFSEKMNSLIRELSKINSMDNHKDIMISINKNFQNVLSSNTIHLWMVDHVKGKIIKFLSIP